MKTEKKDKLKAILSLEERLDNLIRKYKNTPPEDRSQYEERIKRLCINYRKLSGSHYIWNNQSFQEYSTIDIIRDGDRGAVG